MVHGVHGRVESGAQAGDWVLWAVEERSLMHPLSLDMSEWLGAAWLGRRPGEVLSARQVLE